MNIPAIILIGLVAAIAAKLLQPGKALRQWAIALFIGLTGAFIAAGMARIMDWYDAGEMKGLVFPAVGASILLFMWRQFYSPRRTLHY